MNTFLTNFLSISYKKYSFLFKVFCSINNNQIISLYILDFLKKQKLTKKNVLIYIQGLLIISKTDNLGILRIHPNSNLVNQIPLLNEQKINLNNSLLDINHLVINKNKINTSTFELLNLFNENKNNLNFNLSADKILYYLAQNKKTFHYFYQHNLNFKRQIRSNIFELPLINIQKNKLKEKILINHESCDVFEIENWSEFAIFSNDLNKIGNYSLINFLIKENDLYNNLKKYFISDQIALDIFKNLPICESKIYDDSTGIKLQHIKNCEFIIEMQNIKHMHFEFGLNKLFECLKLTNIMDSQKLKNNFKIESLNGLASNNKTLDAIITNSLGDKLFIDIKNLTQGNITKSITKIKKNLNKTNNKEITILADFSSSPRKDQLFDLTQKPGIIYFTENNQNSFISNLNKIQFLNFDQELFENLIKKKAETKELTYIDYVEELINSINLIN